MDDHREQQQHVILFPFMAKGHIIPFTVLAEHLHRRRPDLIITIINTPRNIQTIQSSFPPISTIRFRSLPFIPSDHGLPPATECLSDLSFSNFVTLYHAAESLKPHFHQLLLQIIQEDGHLPLCIIADKFLAWTVSPARNLGIFHSIFITSGAFGSAVYSTFLLHLQRLPTNETHYLSLPDFPEVNLHWSQLPRHLFFPDDNFVDKWSSFLRRQILHCFESNAMLVNTVKGFETKGLCMLQKLTGIPVFPIGPLLRKPSTSSSSLSSCVEFLDKHLPSTVLYISFGSQNSINGSQMIELAAGLEASEKAFIWVIRPPVGFDIAGEFKPEWLPEGFEERIKDKKQGMLVYGWAPQVEILAHESTSAFLSHCGWNSMLESLSHGVPIIGWPISGDQTYNSKFLEEEVGVCVELGRGNMENHSVGVVHEVGRERVKKVVEMVMGGSEKGVEMKKKAMEVSELMTRALMVVDNGDMGSSIHELEEFLNAAAFSVGHK